MKEHQLTLYYDEEGDFLEFHIGEFAPGYFKNLGDGIFERRDDDTQAITGFAIHDFKKRIATRQDTKLSLPFRMKLYS